MVVGGSAESGLFTCQILWDWPVVPVTISSFSFPGEEGNWGGKSEGKQACDWVARSLFQSECFFLWSS